MIRLHSSSMLLAGALLLTLPAESFSQFAATGQAQRLAAVKQQAQQRLHAAKQARYGVAPSSPAGYAKPTPASLIPTPIPHISANRMSPANSAHAATTGVSAPQSAAAPGNVRHTASSASLSGVRTAIALFSADIGRAPTAAEGLGALLTRPPGVKNWRGPYISSANWHQALTDLWGNPYRYNIFDTGRSQTHIISSDGPDRTQGTADDLTVQF